MALTPAGPSNSLPGGPDRIRDYSDVLAEVANAVTREVGRPKRAARDLAPRLAGSNFPYVPLTAPCSGERGTTQPRKVGCRSRRAQAKR